MQRQNFRRHVLNTNNFCWYQQKQLIFFSFSQKCELTIWKKDFKIISEIEKDFSIGNSNSQVRFALLIMKTFFL